MLFAFIVCTIFAAFVFFTNISSWELYLDFAKSWKPLIDAEQQHLDSLEKKISTVTNPQELMLYDSLIELYEDTVKRRQGYANKWMNKIPKWYLNARKRFIEQC